MLRLKEYISNTLTLLKALKEQKNRYYYNSATGVTGTYQTTFTVCTLENLPKGVYLVLGRVGANVGSSSTIMSSTIQAIENCTLLSSSSTSRTTMLSGGGCTSWALAEVTEGNGSIRVTTYKYYNGSVGYGGNIVAIRLI